MLPARERRERQIRLFSADAAKRALFDAARQHKPHDDFAFLDFLDDDTLDAMAKLLLTAQRRRQRWDQRSRTEYQRQIALNQAAE